MWNVYLKRASGALLGTKKESKNPHRQSEALDELKRIVGLETKRCPMDKAYFSDPKNVRADLEEFLKQSGKKTIAELTTGNPECNIEIAARNGERVRFGTYLLRATVALGLAKNHREAGGVRLKTLDELKKKIGLDIKKYPEMDAKYFEDKENVRKDFAAFAKTYGCEVKKLSTNYDGKTTVCANGERVTLDTYLRRVAVGLGMAKGHRGAGDKKAKAVDELKKRAGVDVKNYPMESKYFWDTENLQRDLEAFAEACGRGIVELSMSSKYMSKKALCSNGEVVRLQTYLLRAAVGLGLAKNHKEAGGKMAETLRILKQKVTSSEK